MKLTLPCSGSIATEGDLTFALKYPSVKINILSDYMLKYYRDVKLPFYNPHLHYNALLNFMH